MPIEPTEITFDHAQYVPRRQPRATVEFANALDGSWELLPYPVDIRLRDACAPEYGVCDFSREYGELTRPDRNEPDQYLPYELRGKFVRVTFPPEDEEFDPYIWIGLVEQEELELMGNMVDIPTGMQKFRAYGLGRLLDRVVIDSYTYRTPDGEFHTVPAVRGFNIQWLDGIDYGRNRTVTSTSGVHTFIESPTFGQQWNAWDAVHYLLREHGPRDGVGRKSVNVEVRTPYEGAAEDVRASMLNWYEIREEVRGRSVWQLLNALIPRERGVGFWIRYEEPVTPADPEAPPLGEDEEADPESLGTIILELFTFTNDDLVFLDEKVLPANNAQTIWNFERDVSVVDKPVLTSLETLRYDRIIVEGGNITTTATFALDPNAGQLVPMWRAAQMDAFKTATRDSPGYADRTLSRKQWDNYEFREHSLLVKDVVTGWELRPYNQQVRDTINVYDTARYWLFPQWTPKLVTPEEGGDPVETPDPLGAPLWRANPPDADATTGQDFNVRGARFLAALPWLDQVSADDLPNGTELEPVDSILDGTLADEEAQAEDPTKPPRVGTTHRKPFVFGPDLPPPEEGAPDDREWLRYDEPRVLELPNQIRYSENWILNIVPGEGWPSVRLYVENGAQSLLARREWFDPVEFPDDTPEFPPAPEPEDPPPTFVVPAETRPEHDPTHYGWDWSRLRLTATVDHGIPLRFVKNVNNVGRLRTARVKRIYVPSAGVDLVAPKTVVQLIGGQLDQIGEEGAILKDDRRRLSRVADSAALWYSKTRRQLNLTRRRVSIPEATRLGNLVVRVGSYYSSLDINTPITSIEIDDEKGTVNWLTGFVDLEIG